jgi:LysM repeat protein
MIARHFFLVLALGLTLVFAIACRQATPVLDEEDDEPSPTPELAQPTAIAQATSTSTAVPTPPATPTVTSPPPPSATVPSPGATRTATSTPDTGTATTVPPSPTATPCGPPPTWEAYTVISGDTLASLAQATAVTVAAIQLANCLEDTLIFAGSTLYLPSLPTPTATLPPPPPLVIDGSQPLGTAPVAGELVYDDVFLVRVDVRRPSAGDENGAGIDYVEFVVSHEGTEVYRHTEETPAYCIFGGGEPACNPWPLGDGVYRWGLTGPLIEPGHYLVRAWLYFTPESDDGSGITHDFWDFTFDLATPAPRRLEP